MACGLCCGTERRLRLSAAVGPSQLTSRNEDDSRNPPPDPARIHAGRRGCSLAGPLGRRNHAFLSRGVRPGRSRTVDHAQPATICGNRSRTVGDDDWTVVPTSRGGDRGSPRGQEPGAEGALRPLRELEEAVGEANLAAMADFAGRSLSAGPPRTPGSSPWPRRAAAEPVLEELAGKNREAGALAQPVENGYYPGPTSGPRRAPPREPQHRGHP